MSKIDKKTVFVAAFVIVAMLLTCAMFASYNKKDSTVTIAKESQFNIGDTKDIDYGIEKVTSSHHNATEISGWCALKGVSYDLYNYGNDAYRSEVYNYTNFAFVDAGQVYILPTKLSLREDISQRLNDGIDYAYSGFASYLPSDYTNLLTSAKPALLLKDPKGNETLYLLDDDSVKNAAKEAN